MNIITLTSFHDELLKIAGAMEDAGGEYASMMKQHASNPKFRAALHPSEQGLAYKTIAQNSNNTTRIADLAQNARSQTLGSRATVGAPSLAQMAAKAGMKPAGGAVAPIAARAGSLVGKLAPIAKKLVR